MFLPFRFCFCFCFFVFLFFCLLFLFFCFFPFCLLVLVKSITGVRTSQQWAGREGEGAKESRKARHWCVGVTVASGCCGKEEGAQTALCCQSASVHLRMRRHHTHCPLLQQQRSQVACARPILCLVSGLASGIGALLSSPRARRECWPRLRPRGCERHSVAQSSGGWLCLRPARSCGKPRSTLCSRRRVGVEMNMEG